MIVKIFGALDIFIGLAFLFSEVFNLVLGSFIIVLALFLLLKGIFFIISDLDIISFLDVACGIIMLLSTMIVMPSLIVYLVSIFLIQKGIFSLI